MESIGSREKPRKPPVFRPWAAWTFEAFFLPWRNFRLKAIHFQGLPDSLPPNRPVLLVGNHVSNWDGFLFREIQRRLRPGWPTYSIMLAKELARYPFFRSLGGIGLEPGSPASFKGALRAAAFLRGQGNDFFLSFFPQGRIFPSFKRPLGFQGGVDLLVRALAPVTVIPVALHMEPLGGLAAPSFFVALGRPMKVDKPSILHRVLEDLVQAEIDRTHALLSLHGEATPGALVPPGLSVRTLC